MAKMRHHARPHRCWVKLGSFVARMSHIAFFTRYGDMRDLAIPDVAPQKGGAHPGYDPQLDAPAWYRGRWRCNICAFENARGQRRQQVRIAKRFYVSATVVALAVSNLPAQPRAQQAVNIGADNLGGIVTSA